jgi:hypothetical protein
MHCSFVKFILVLSSFLLFWKLLGMLEVLLCSISASQIKIVPLLDALQLLIVFAGALTYLKPELFFSIICYSCSFFLLKY